MAGRAGVQFYLLIQLLRREASLVDITATAYLTNLRILRLQTSTNNHVAKVIREWDLYQEGKNRPDTMHDMIAGLVGELYLLNLK